jgi:hypothetical protein
MDDLQDVRTSRTSVATLRRYTFARTKRLSHAGLHVRSRRPATRYLGAGRSLVVASEASLQSLLVERGFAESASLVPCFAPLGPGRHDHVGSGRAGSYLATKSNAESVRLSLLSDKQYLCRGRSRQ